MHIHQATVHRYCIVPQRVRKKIRNHALCRRLFVTEIGYHAEASFQPWPRNSGGGDFLIVYVVKGSGWYTARGKRNKVMANNFFVLPATWPVVATAAEDDPWSMYWAYFSGTQAPDVVAHLMHKNAVAPRKAKFLAGRIAQFDDILHHLELMENIENLVYANSRFYSFLCSFRLTVLSAKHEKKDGVIQSIEYMRQNIYGQVTLEALAGVAGLSVSHYCAVFRRKTMQTPLSLFTSMKVQRACQLLRPGDQTIKSIAYQLGFFDQYHFSRVFKQVMGTSPKAFSRKQ